MRYLKFRIENYRAITGAMEINLDKDSLIPVIGVNESGKTTILHALFAFDFYNDLLNDNGRHLKDIHNLYTTTERPATVSAEIELTPNDFGAALDSTLKKGNAGSTTVDALAKAGRLYRKQCRQMPPVLTITRNVKSKRYSIDPNDLFPDSTLNDLLAKEILRHLPYILFFDDFRDSVEERYEIIRDEDGETSSWLSIIEQLFKQTDREFSVFKLADLEDRTRSTVISKVNKHLNATLTKEWQNFRLDDTDALRIAIMYERVPVAGGTDRHFLKLEVIERDADGDEYHFYIRDRSKGFFWFFNFVMKLEFNPKIVDADQDAVAIYLLDEPGSYLHASAQSKLCQKLRNLSRTNHVIYCTHSHYLLDPEIIPLSSIKVADKDGHGNVRLIPIHEHHGNIFERRSAFQPVIDALKIKPFLLDLSYQKVIITEGIVDYYAFEMFKHGRKVNTLPSVGANSIKYYVSLMIAWRVEYCALWDNDPEGRKEMKKAVDIFGDEIATRYFYSLPLKGKAAKNRILQDLFDGSDLIMIRAELGMSANAGFDATIGTLYYHDEKASVLAKISQKTRRNFEEVFELLPLS